MPQVIPYYFVNQLSLIYIISKYLLPLFTLQQVIRMFIVKLNNKS